MDNLINHEGSVDDIRCGLSYIDPKTTDFWTLRMLEASLKDEKEEHYNRSTVIKMLETKIRQVKKHHNINC